MPYMQYKTARVCQPCYEMMYAGKFTLLCTLILVDFNFAYCIDTYFFSAYLQIPMSVV